MLTERYFLDVVNRRLCVRAEVPLSAEPKLSVLWWPIGNQYAAEWTEYIGLPLVDYGGYSESYTLALEGERGSSGVKHFSWHRQVSFVLCDGRSTKPIKSEIRSIPCPKVCKGIETRWHDGQWEKYLRTRGWVVA